MHFSLSSIRSSRGVIQTIVTLCGSLVASAFAAISLILITRHLGPEKFGEFSVGFAILLILTRLNDLGMTNTVLKYVAQESNHTQINKLLSYATRIKLLGFGGICILGLVLSDPIAKYLHFSQPALIYLAFFLSAATSFYEHLQAVLQSLHKFTESAIANVMQAFVKLCSGLFLYFSLSASAVPIFFAYMIAPAVPLLFVRPILIPSWIRLKIQDTFINEQALVKKLAFHSSINFVAAGIIENIDILFLQRYMSTYEAGLYGGVSRIALLFSILAYALSTVLNSRVAKYKNKADIKSFTLKAVAIMGASVLGYLLFLSFSKAILLFTIGEAYLPGLGIMNILVAASFLTVAVVPFIALFFSFDVPWFFSVSGVLQLVIVIGGNLLFVPLHGVEAAAWVRLCARLALFIFTVLLAVYMYRKTYVTASQKA